MFVEIPNTSWKTGQDSKESEGVDAISKFCNELKRVKTIDTFSTNGGFWKMELGTTTIENSSSVSINSKLLLPDKLRVGNFNLLDKSNIPEGLSLSSNNYIFESIILKPNKESIDISADFSSKEDEEISLRDNVAAHNNLVEEELANYQADLKYSAGFNSGILYESNKSNESGFLNKGVLINYMNEKIHKPNTILYG